MIGLRSRVKSRGTTRLKSDEWGGTPWGGSRALSGGRKGGAGRALSHNGVLLSQMRAGGLKFETPAPPRSGGMGENLGTRPGGV